MYWTRAGLREPSLRLRHHGLRKRTFQGCVYIRLQMRHVFCSYNRRIQVWWGPLRYLTNSLGGLLFWLGQAGVPLFRGWFARIGNRAVIVLMLLCTLVIGAVMCRTVDLGNLISRAECQGAHDVDDLVTKFGPMIGRIRENITIRGQPQTKRWLWRAWTDFS
jgi:hypothetical protein